MSMTPTNFLVLSTLTLTVSLIFRAVDGADIESDKQALVALKNSLDDPNKALFDWDINRDPCTWDYVACQNNRVTSLLLGSNNLGGILVPELGGLSALEDLSFINNTIEGTIPAELGNLENLRILGLSDNYLSGEIPPPLGNLKSLNLLNLDHNNLTGKIPSDIGNLPSLTLADFSGNNLCWDFWPTPKFVGNYTLCQKKLNDPL